MQKFFADLKILKGIFRCQEIYCQNTHTHPLCVCSNAECPCAPTLIPANPPVGSGTSR